MGGFSIWTQVLRSHYQPKSNKQYQTFKNILSHLASVSRTEHINQKQRVDLLTDSLIFTLLEFYIHYIAAFYIDKKYVSIASTH